MRAAAVIVSTPPGAPPTAGVYWNAGWLIVKPANSIVLPPKPDTVSAVLFVATIALLAIPSRRSNGNAAVRTAEQTVGRAVRAPLAATFFVLALAQFPLQIAAPRLMYLTLGALAISWDHDDA